MTIKYGTSDIDAAYVGVDPVDAIYLGSDLLWEAGSPLSPPDSFATLSMWFDPTYSSSLTLSGSQVTNWASRVGSFNAAQATAGKRPLSGTRTVNGKNVLDFTAASLQFLDCGDVNDLGTDSFVLSCMVQLDATDTTNALCGKHVFGTTDGRYGLACNTTGVQGAFDTDTLASGMAYKPSMPPAGLPVVLTMRVTRNGAGSRNALWFNDTKVQDVMFIDAGASLDTTAKWLIGSYAEQAGYYMDGVMGDVVMLKGTAAAMPTDAELSPFIAWMMDKYAIPFHPWQFSGLQGWWKLDETSGTTALDYSGHGRNSSYSGGYTLAAATGGPVAHADFGNGSGSRVAISDNDGFSDLSGLTLFALIKPDDVSTIQARQIVSKLNTSQFEWSFNVNTVAGGRLTADIYGPGSGTALQEEYVAGLTTGWQAVAAAINMPMQAARFGLWLNGVKGSTQGATGSVVYANGSSVVNIGWRADSTANQYFQGGIAHVLIFNVEQTDLNIRRLMTYFSDAGYTVAPPALPSSGGGVETLLGDYKYYTFNSNGIFIPESGINYGACVVAGGGAGGVNNGGGGGAGGVTRTTITFPDEPQAIMIGQGGIANPYDTIVQALRNGGNTYCGPLMAVGGGYGGQYYGTGGAGTGPGGGLGGSGGGGARATTTAGLAYTGQGFAGGLGKASTTLSGGGGGGAGGVGAPANNVGGVGGIGIETFTGSGVWVGGGGGGWQNASNTANVGGLGGGGAGSPTAAGNGTAGTANTGGGGGASGGSGSGNSPQLAGSGGSGVVILRKAQTTYHSSLKAAIATLSPTWSWDTGVGSGNLTALTGGVAMAPTGSLNYGRAIGTGGLVGVDFVSDARFDATISLVDDAAFTFFITIKANGTYLDANNYVIASTNTAGLSSFNAGMLCLIQSNEASAHGLVSKTGVIRQDVNEAPTNRAGTSFTYALTYTGSAVKLYINGVNLFNTAYSGGVDHNGVIRLGQTLGNAPAANVSPFRGVLGYPAFWSGTALSDANITTLHAASGL